MTENSTQDDRYNPNVRAHPPIIVTANVAITRVEY